MLDMDFGRSRLAVSSMLSGAWRCLALVCMLLAVGCASAPGREPGSPVGPRPAVAPTAGATPLATAADASRDGPGANPPPDLHLVPDAVPQLEPVREGGPNKPYDVLGQAYTPLRGDPVVVQRGLASWYGRKFHGRSTANGETYNMYAMTAAHRTMPLPSYARVRNPANGREVVLRVNDRGPFHSQRVMDLSYTAALKLGLLGGVGMVEIERITDAAIRTGAWRAPATLAGMVGESAVAADDVIGEIAQRNTTAPPPRLPGHLAAAAGPPPLIAPVGSALPAETGAPALAANRAARGFWLQLGAFAQPDGAMNFQARVARDAAWLAPLLAIFHERSLHRLQAGPYASRADAHSAGERLSQALSLVPGVVERR